MDKKTTFIKGISVQSVVVLLRGALELIVFAIMSRLLTKMEFGYYAAITGVVFIVSSITEAGFGSAIIQKKDATVKFINTAFTLSWFTGIIGMMVMMIIAPLIAKIIVDESITIPLRIMSVNIFLACTASVGRSVLMRNLEFRKYGAYELCSYFISSLIGVIMAIYHCGLYSIVAISVCNMILINIVLYTKSVKLPKFHIATQEVRGIFSFGGWLTMGVIINNITQQLDRLLLPRWLSVEILGAYNRPAGFVNTATGQINGIIDTVLFPMLSSIQNETAKVSNVLLQAVSILNTFSGVLFCVFFFNAELIVSIFFGKEWLSLSSVLQIISIYIIFNIDNRLVDSFFRSLGLVKLGFFLRLFSVVLTFCFIFCGCKFGIYGVASAIVFANILTVVIKMFALTQKTNTPFNVVVCSFFLSQKAVLVLLIEGVVFVSVLNNPSLWGQILFMIVMGLTIIVEFLFFPKFVGHDYYNSVYSIIYPSVVRALKKNRL